jgi:hypothetical protein
MATRTAFNRIADLDASYVTLSAQLAALAARTSTGPVVDVAITLTPNHVAERSGAGFVIGSLTINRPGAWTYALIENASGKVAIDGDKIKTTASQLFYATGASRTCRIAATSPDGSTIVTLPVGFTVDFVDNDGPDATASMDFVSGPAPVFTGGAALADVGEFPVLSPLGLKVVSIPAEYIGKDSMSPALWATDGQFGSWAALPINADGFTPARFTGNYGSGHFKTTTLRTLRTGELFTAKFRFETDMPTTGIEIGVGGATPGYFGLNLSPTAAPNIGQGTNVSPVLAVISPTVTDVVFHGVATADGPVNFDFRIGGSGGTVIVHGGQVVAGGADQPWLNIGSSIVSTQAVSMVLGGPIAAILARPAWTLAIETNGNGITAMLGDILTYGATGSENVLIKSGGRSHATTGDGKLVAPCATGGFLGIARVVVAQDSNGLTLICNGGQPITVPAIAVAGILKLFATSSGFVRRIHAWDQRLADAFLKVISDPGHYVHPDASLGAASKPRAGVATYWEDFGPSFDLANHDGAGDAYSQSGGANSGDGYAADFARKKFWRSRYTNWIEPIGSNNQTLNGENALLMDQQWIDTKRAKGEWTDPWNAITVNASLPGAQPNSSVRLSCKPVALLDDKTQALIPKQNGGAEQWKYLGSAMITPDTWAKIADAPSLEVNTTFVSRAKMPPWINGLWTGIWGITYYWGWETDLQESCGNVPNRLHTSVHAPYDGYHRSVDKVTPFDLSADFDVYESYWEPGKQHISLSGAYLGFNPTNRTFDDSKQYLLLDLTMGGAMGGIPDQATTDAVAAAGGSVSMDVDFIGILSNV